MAIAMVAMLAFGGTYAYFTATAGEMSDSVTTGIIKLDNNTVALSAVNVVSGEELLSGDDDKIVVTNSGSTRGYWVFVTFNVEIEGVTGAVVATDKADFDTKVAAVENDGKDIYCLDYDVITGEGKWAKVDGETNVWGYHVTDTAVESATDIDVCTSIKFYGRSASVATPADGDTEATVTQGSLMGKTITVSVTAQAIQDILEEDGTTELTLATAWGALSN